MTEVKILEPGEILAEIAARPLLAREQAQAGYLGQYVDWTLILADVHRVTSGEVRLLLRRRANEMRYVATNVALANYPWLTSLHNGSAVQLRGRIAAVDSRAIEIDAADVIRTT